MDLLYIAELIVITCLMVIIVIFYINIKNFKKETRRLLDFQKLVFDIVPDIIFIKDEEFRIVQANSAFISFYPPESRDKIIGFTTIENYDSAEANAFLEKDKEALENGYSKIIESIKFPDGQTRTLSTQKVRFENTTGEKFILGISNDITEQDLLQKETEKAQAIYRMIMDFFPGMVFVKDRDSKIIFANNKFIASFPPEKQSQIIGHTTFDNYPEDLRNQFLKQDQDTFKEGETSKSFLMTYVNGSQAHVTVRKVCFADRNGNEYLLCTIT